MKITASKIREVLQCQWPNLKHIWIFDRKLELLTQEQSEEILQGITVYKKQFKDELFDCDDFALVAHAFVKLKSAELLLPNSWAFGEVSLFYPQKGIHNQNIYITEDLKVKLFEPQTNITTNPNQEIAFYARF